uniref:Uncharacterized protein n=1 Tax=Anguilla anguilla TaxID=7936 RepID=A0A0E9UZU7_ANGAN
MFYRLQNYTNEE